MMDILLGYGGVAALFAVIVFVLETNKRSTSDFSEYATAGRSFGPLFSMMSFVNTWYPGTMFISFAGFAAASGVMGYYFVPYSLLAVVLMFFLARPVHVWGRRFDLRTQADLLGLRYNSRPVRVIAAVIGIIASFPWIVLGMQSLTLVFAYLSFGRVDESVAVFIGIGVLAARQLWTVRMGARGIVLSDMVQGIVAYLFGTVLIIGLLTWLLTNGHGFSAPSAAMFTIPGPGTEMGGLYFMSLVLTGTLGGWCWPDIFVRLFASNGTLAIKRAAVQGAPLLFVFGASLSLLAIAASTLPGVADAPDAVWFITAEIGGPLAVTLAGMCVVAATMGNVGANLQALGSQTANDVVGVVRNRRITDPRIGQIAVTLMVIASAVFAVSTAHTVSGLVTLAMMSYQGIAQLAPTLFLGIFWRRGNAVGAITSMIGGFGTAAFLHWHYPISVPGFAGLTSGCVALLVNLTLYVGCAYAFSATADERKRVNDLFDSLELSDNQPQASSTPPIKGF